MSQPVYFVIDDEEYDYKERKQGARCLIFGWVR